MQLLSYRMQLRMNLDTEISIIRYEYSLGPRQQKDGSANHKVFIDECIK